MRFDYRVILDKEEGYNTMLLSIVGKIFRKDLWALIWLTFFLVYLGDQNVSFEQDLIIIKILIILKCLI